MALPKISPGASSLSGDATGADFFVSKGDCEDTPKTENRKTLIDAMRAERRRLRVACLSIDCIGLALTKNVIDLDTAERHFHRVPKLQYGDPFVDDFCAEVERKAEAYQRQQSRRRSRGAEQ